MVEDTMDDMVLTPYNHSESAFNFQDGRMHHNVDYHNYGHVPLYKPQLHHSLIAVHRRLSTAYHYNFNHNAAKAKPMYEARAAAQETRNFRAYELNYNSCNKRRKQVLHKSKNFTISR